MKYLPQKYWKSIGTYLLDLFCYNEDCILNYMSLISLTMCVCLCAKCLCFSTMTLKTINLITSNLKYIVVYENSSYTIRHNVDPSMVLHEQRSKVVKISLLTGHKEVGPFYHG